MTTPIYNLEERLIQFAVEALTTAEKLPSSQGARVLCHQLCKSCTSPALNYAEAQAAESDRDFLHKMRICLKELRETQVCLRIIAKKPYVNPTLVEPVLNECSELVAMFVAGVRKKQMNMRLR